MTGGKIDAAVEGDGGGAFDGAEVEDLAAGDPCIAAGDLDEPVVAGAAVPGGAGVSARLSQLWR